MGKLVLAKEVGASLSVGANIFKRRLVPSGSVDVDQLKRRLVPSGSVGVDQFIKEGCFLQNQLVLINQSVGALKFSWC